MPSDQPPTHASATPDHSPLTRVIVCLDGAAIAWAACDDPHIDLILLDADMPTSGAIADCYRLSPILPTAIATKWRVLIDAFLGEPLAAGLGGTSAQMPDSESRPACRHCGSFEWRVVERMATAFDARQDVLRPLGTAERGVTCAACGRAPDDFESVEATYLAIASEAPLFGAAHAVIEAWERGDLAASVRSLSAALASNWYPGQISKQTPGDVRAARGQIRVPQVPIIVQRAGPPTLRELLLRVRFLFGVTRLVNAYQDELLCVYVLEGSDEDLAVTSVTQAVADLLGLPYYPERDALQVAFQIGGVTHRIAEMINAMWEMPGHLRGIDL